MPLTLFFSPIYLRTACTLRTLATLTRAVAFQPNCFEHESSQFRCRSSLAGIRFHLFPSWLPGSTLSTECIFKYYFKVDWRIGSQTVFLIILAKKSGLAETK